MKHRFALRGETPAAGKVMNFTGNIYNTDDKKTFGDFVGYPCSYRGFLTSSVTDIVNRLVFPWATIQHPTLLAIRPASLFLYTLMDPRSPLGLFAALSRTAYEYTIKSKRHPSTAF